MNQDYNETKENSTDKIKSFQFDEIIKKQKRIEKKPQVQTKKSTIEIKKRKQRRIKQKKAYKYKQFTFKSLQDVSDFLFLEGEKKEKHATILLNNKAFLKWLHDISDKKELVDKWIEEVVK